MINPLRRAAEAARARVSEARSHPALADVSPEDIVSAHEAQRLAAIASRVHRVREAQQEADELTARAEQLDQAVTEHHAAEAREVERVNTAAAALDASRRALGKAATAADRALAGLYAAAEAHDALVVQTAAELRAAGLTACPAHTPAGPFVRGRQVATPPQGTRPPRGRGDALRGPSPIARPAWPGRYRTALLRLALG